MTQSNISFDGFADDYEKHHDNYLPLGVRSEEFLRQKSVFVKNLSNEALASESSINLLDFGCGTGRLAESLINWKKLGTYYGLDDSQSTIDEARERLSSQNNFKFVQNFNEIPNDFRPNLILALNVFHHVSPVLREQKAQELTNLLVPNGVLVLWEHNPWNPITRTLVKICPFDKGVKLLTKTTGLNLFRRQLLECIDQRFLNITPPSLQRLAFFKYLEKNLNRYPLGAQYRLIFRKKSHD